MNSPITVEHAKKGLPVKWDKTSESQYLNGAREGHKNCKKGQCKPEKVEKKKKNAITL